MNALQEALSELSRGRHNIAHDILADATITFGFHTDEGFTAASAANWIRSGMPLMASAVLANFIVGGATLEAMTRRAACA